MFEEINTGYPLDFQLKKIIEAGNFNQLLVKNQLAQTGEKE